VGDDRHQFAAVQACISADANAVRTVTEGSFGISVGDFILQDQYGFVTSAGTVASAE